MVVSTVRGMVRTDRLAVSVACVLCLLAGVTRGIWWALDARLPISAYYCYSIATPVIPVRADVLSRALKIDLEHAERIQETTLHWAWEDPAFDRDPWGSAWASPGPGLWATHSIGPNKLDEHGDGDDLAVVPRWVAVSFGVSKWALFAAALCWSACYVVGIRCSSDSSRDASALIQLCLFVAAGGAWFAIERGTVAQGSLSLLGAWLLCAASAVASSKLASARRSL